MQEQDRIRNTLWFMLGFISISLYIVMILAYGLCSPITIILTTLSDALWIWVSILHLKERMASVAIPLPGDLSFRLAVSVMAALATLGVIVIAVLSVVQQRCSF
jgi:hypothetical protein